MPWQKLRDTVEVKLLGQDEEVYVLAKSEGRRQKETAIRRRKLARLLRTLRSLRRTRQRPWKRDTLLHKLGAAHKEAGRAWGFVKITVPKARQPVNRDTFQFELLKDKLKDAQQRDGHYLLRGFERRRPGGHALGTLYAVDAKSRRPSRRSRATCNCARSATTSSCALRRTFWSAFWPTA